MNIFLVGLVFSKLFGITAFPTSWWDTLSNEEQDAMIIDHVAPMFFANSVNADCSEVRITTKRLVEDDGKYEIIIFYGECKERKI